MLIIESHADLRKALRQFLRLAYPELVVFEASDSRRALELCLEGRFQLVLLDIALPDISGIELIRPITLLQPQAQIIVMSQSAGRADTERAKAAGAFECVAKHALFDELKPAVERALETRFTQ
jgi:DNA-binding NarL/FixJ family response regulator